MTSIIGPEILQRIGNTPLYELSSYSNENIKFYAKLEWHNPFGSVKDRAAYWMIKDAEKKGSLVKNKSIIIEPTSGNTGIALAGIALATAIAKPRSDVYYMPNQYENDSNFLAHYESTGPEIWEQTNGKVTHFLTGCGTGGTITGTGAFLKEKDMKIQVIAIQAQKNHLLQGLRNFEESAMPDLFKRHLTVVDDWITATNEDSFNSVKQLFEKEQLLVGPSSGSVMASMIKTAEKLESGNLVGIFADDGRKFKSLYLQQNIFSERKYETALRNAKNLSNMPYIFS